MLERGGVLVLVALALAAPMTAAAQPLAPEEALLAPASGAATKGGSAVAIDGDYALVGVPGTGTATTPGTIYIYHRTAPATWVLEQTVADPEPAASHSGDTFGASIAISGTTAIVGDPGHATMTGQAWVLTRTGGTPAWTSVRVPRPASAPSRFGTSVAIAPDGASGYFVAVGAPDSGGGRGGEVFLFDEAGTLRGEQLTIPTGAGLFGTALAISASSTHASLLVGAPGSNEVYPFSLDTHWVAGPTLVAPSAGKFGFSVAVAPGGLVAVIGAHEESSHGAAYVLTRSMPTDAWPDIGTAAHLVPADNAASDHFGTSVAASDEAVVVGAPNHDAPMADSGSVYLYLPDGSGSGWHVASGYRASGGMASDQLGAAVAVAQQSIVGGAPRPMATLGYAAVFPFPLDNGSPCTLDDRCASSACVDDVCCDTACGGGLADDCVACSTLAGATTNGTCTSARETMTCSGCAGGGTCGAGVCSSSVGCDTGAMTMDDGGIAPNMDGGPKHHVSGCKCEVAGAGSPGLALGASALLLIALGRRRRTTRRAKESC